MTRANKPLTQAGLTQAHSKKVIRQKYLSGSDQPFHYGSMFTAASDCLQSACKTSLRNTCLFPLVFVLNSLVLYFFHHFPSKPIDTAFHHNLQQYQLPIICCVKKYLPLYNKSPTCLAVLQFWHHMIEQTTVLHLLFAINCLHNLENFSHIPSFFRILFKLKHPMHFNFSSSFFFFSPGPPATRTISSRQNVYALKFHTGKKIVLPSLLTSQHRDMPDIMNKPAWDYLQEIYVMSLSKLSSSSVFNLFFTLLLQAHIPPSQVHTSLFLLHSHFPKLSFQL